MTLLLATIALSCVMYGLGWLTHEYDRQATWVDGYEHGRDWRRGIPVPSVTVFEEPRGLPFDWELHDLFDDVNNAREITAWMSK